MSTPLKPSPQTIVAMKNSIQNTLSTGMPAPNLLTILTPMVQTVNEWSTQIPVLLESVPSTNHVFEIRSLIFNAPRFTENVFKLPFAELPLPFQEFMTFIHKLIAAQKGPKDKPVPKVRNTYYPPGSFSNVFSRFL